MRLLGVSLLIAFSICCCKNHGNGDDEELSPEDAPKCGGKIDVDPEDTDEDDTDEDDSGPNYWMPSRCSGMWSAVRPGCASIAVGAVKIGDQEHELAFACISDTSIADWGGGGYFEGFTLTLVPEDNCFPMVTLAVHDLSKCGEPPFEVSFDTPLCDDSAIRLLGMTVETEDNCLSLLDHATGKLSVADHHVGFGAIEGSAVAQGLHYDSDSDPVAVEVTFDVALRSAAQGTMEMHMDALDICAPPSGRPGR